MTKDKEPKPAHIETELELIAQEINAAMAAGEHIFDYLESLRKLPRPIAVDFNNVVANNIHPIVQNPEGAAFLKKLRQTGSIVIVTKAHNWPAVQEILKSGNMWESTDVLLVSGNWTFHDLVNRELLPEAREIIQNYIDVRGIFTIEDFKDEEKKLLPFLCAHMMFPLLTIHLW